MQTIGIQVRYRNSIFYRCLERVKRKRELQDGREIMKERGDERERERDGKQSKVENMKMKNADKSERESEHERKQERRKTR